MSAAPLQYPAACRAAAHRDLQAVGVSLAVAPGHTAGCGEHGQCLGVLLFAAVSPSPGHGQALCGTVPAELLTPWLPHPADDKDAGLAGGLPGV